MAAQCFARGPRRGPAGGGAPDARREGQALAARVTSVRCTMHKQRLNTGSRPHKPRASAILTKLAPPSDLADDGSPVAQVAVEAAVAVEEGRPLDRQNREGLNGLTTGGVSGLATGVFAVTAVQPIRYAVEEVAGLFDIDNETMLRGVVPDSFPSQLAAQPVYAGRQRRFVVMDDNVHRLYGSQVRQYFAAHDVDFHILALPTNEANKNFDLVFEVARQLEAFHLNRRKEPIIAIGGGVCLDVAGLAANLYRRNTPVIKVPTTVMAAIDASIGIKTAVNFEEKKNKLGTYCPPLAVFIDRMFLKTLDQRNLSNGAAEILKMACIKDQHLFELLHSHAEELIAGNFQSLAACEAMRRSIQGMLEELEPNLWEHVLCRVVDYGHTFSPEIEMAALRSGAELLHGEAVNIDMALTTQMSYARGLLTLSQRNRVFNVMQRLRLPFTHSVVTTDLLLKALRDTTRARDGLQRLPIMDGVGRAVFVYDLSDDEVVAAAAELTSIAAAMPTQPLAAPSGPWVVGNIVATHDMSKAAPAAV